MKTTKAMKLICSYDPIAQALDLLGLSATAIFVPQSDSRNADNEQPSINFMVTVYHEVNGKKTKVVTIPYGLGIGHAKAYQCAHRYVQPEVAYYASEEGLDCCPEAAKRGRNTITRGRIKPDAAALFYCLTMDSEVLNHSSFEEWAEWCGYDADSRKAESMYRECLQTALAIRNSIGDSSLVALAQIFQDY